MAQDPQQPTKASFTTRIPDGEDRPRSVCDACGYIADVNPKIVVGSIATWQDRYLICRRAIHPRKGFWTLPAGFMEEGETVEEAACREAREEACADIEVDRLLAVYSIPRISQVQLMFRARLISPDVRPGPESAEVALVRWADLPWQDLAFPSVHWALNQFDAVRGRSDFAPFANPPGSEHMVR